MEVELLSKLADYGVVGISLALIFAMVYILRIVLKIVGNHINHNTDAWIKNAEAQTRLADTIFDLKETIKDLTIKYK